MENAAGSLYWDIGIMVSKREAQNMRKLILLLKSAKKRLMLFAAIGLSMTAALCRQGVTYFLGEAVTAAGCSQLSVTLNYLSWLAAGILLLFVIDYGSLYFYGSFTYENLYRFRSRTVQSTIRFTLKEKAKYTAETLINRINGDMQLLESFFRNGIRDTSYKLFVGIFSLIFGFFINGQVTLILTALCIITAMVDYYFAKPMEKIQKQIQELSDKTMTAFSDAIRGNKEIKTYGIKASLKERFSDIVKAHMAKVFTAARIECLWGAVEITISIALQIGIVFLCLYFVLRDEMTLGDILVFQQIVEMAKQLYIIDFVNIRKAAAAAGRVAEVWESGETASETSGIVRKGVPGKAILEFQNVSFSYNKDDRRSGKLNNISFSVAPCETVALVGPSGGGKSTIINLICGLLKPDKGGINFLGADVSDWDEQDLYRQISLVDQECRLFPVSIYENIAAGGYGCKEIGMADMEGYVARAVSDAALSDWVKTLKNGLETDVGEYGNKISGGQRQRIAIARALLKSPKLLLMDEPTSALDIRTEQEIMSALNRKVKGKAAVITIAHRLDTIRDFDKILVVENGQITERGTHEELLAQKRTYYRMYEQQHSEIQEAVL